MGNRLLIFVVIAVWLAPLHAQYLVRSLGFGKLTSAAISPDGSKVATGATDGTIRLWDCSTGEVISTFGIKVIRPGSSLIGSWPTEVQSLSFSKSGDTLLAGTGDLEFHLWNVAKGETFDDRYFNAGIAVPSDPATTFSLGLFAENGKILTAQFSSLSYYYANTDSTYTEFPYSGQIKAFAMSADGTKLAIGGDGTTLKLLEIEPPTLIRNFPSGKTNAVAFMPDSPIGMRVLAAGKGIRLWDAIKDSVQLTYGDTSEVLSMVLSADGSRILSSLGNTAIVYDVKSGRKTMTFSGHEDKVFGVGFSSDEKSIFTVSRDNTVRLWEFGSGKLLQVFRGHTENPKCMAFSPDGKNLASASGRTAILWDALTGVSLQTFLGHTGSVQSVAVSPNASMVLTGSMDSTACLWDASTGNPIRKFPGHAGAVNAVAFSPDGKSIFTGSADSTAKLWDATTGTVLRNLTPDTADAIHCANFSPDGKKLIVGSRNGRVYIWNTGDGSLIKAIKARDDSAFDNYRDHSDTVFSAAFFPDNDSFFVSVYYPPSQAGTIEFPRIAVGNLTADTIHWYKNTAAIRSSAVDPKGKFYLLSKQTGTILVKTPDDAHPTFIEKDKHVSLIAINPVEHMAAMAKSDGMIQIWSLSGFASLKKPFGSGARSPGPMFIGARDGVLLFQPTPGNLAIDYPSLVIGTLDGKMVCRCPLISKTGEAILTYRLPIRPAHGNYLCYFGTGKSRAKSHAIRIQP